MRNRLSELSLPTSSDAHLTTPQRWLCLGVIAFAVLVSLEALNWHTEVWWRATMDYVDGESIYWQVYPQQAQNATVAEAIKLDHNPYWTTFQYQPTFAAISFLLSLPLFAIREFNPFLVSVHWIAQVVMLTGVLGFALTLWYGAALGETKQQRRYIIALLAVSPLIWRGLQVHASDVLMMGFVAAGLFYLVHDHYGWAGLAVGLSTFKLTTLPLAAAVGLAALVDDRHDFAWYMAGGVVSQLPSIWYFLQFPEDLLFIIRTRGAMSAASYYFGGVLWPVVEWNAELLYVTSILPVINLLAIIIAAAMIRRERLLFGAALAYLPMGLLTPAEIRLHPLLLIIILGAVLADDWRAYAPALALIAADFWVILGSWDFEELGRANIDNLLSFIISNTQLVAILAGVFILYFVTDPKPELDVSS